MQEVLNALRVVKAFGQEQREEERFVDRSGEGMRARIRLAFADGAFGVLVDLTMALGTAAVLFVGVRHVQSGVLTLGELLLVMGYLAQLYVPLQSDQQAGGRAADLAGERGARVRAARRGAGRPRGPARAVARAVARGNRVPRRVVRLRR